MRPGSCYTANADTTLEHCGNQRRSVRAVTWPCCRTQPLSPHTTAEMIRSGRARLPLCPAFGDVARARVLAPVSTGRSAFDELLGLLPDRDVAAACAGEGLAVPVAPPVAQRHPGKARHEIQL